MKLGTLRFGPKHRAKVLGARERRRLAEWRSIRVHIAQPCSSAGQIRWWAAAKPGEYGVVREEPPPRRRSWWERLTGGRTTIIYGER